MDKETIIQGFVEKLKEEEKKYQAYADQAREGAIDKEILQEAKYDTRAIEAGYLAGSLARRREEITLSRQEMEQFNPRAFSEESSIAVGALVTLESQGSQTHYLLTPNTGALSVDFAGKTIQALSTKSRLGQALVGAELGDEIELKNKKENKSFVIVGLS